MSHLSKIFEEAPVKVQNRNGFDLSHLVSGTSKTGQLVPVLTKLLPPNTTISLGAVAEVSMPPLVSPFYGKVDFIIEGFSIPCSILYGGWKQFISGAPSSTSTTPDVADSQYAATLSSVTAAGGFALPRVNLKTIVTNNYANFNTLAGTNDNALAYMGCNLTSYSSFADSDVNISLLPLLAYHRICDVFYRNSKLTKTWFAVNPNTTYASGLNAKNVSLIWHSFYTEGTDAQAVSGTSGCVFADTASLTFPDNVSIFSTRQRNYTRDYFTSAVASPQQGGAASLGIHVSTSTGDGSFTINALRMANALQKFKETNNLSGDYADMVRNRWGVRPIDADFDEPHYLGRVVIPVYQHSVYQSVDGGSQGSSTSKNPFTASDILGAKAASASFSGEGSICDKFTLTCWSYVMCIASLVPHANYNYGINRELTMTKLGDYPAPELQTVGMEEIRNYEIYADSSSSLLYGTFGYIPRYSRFKYVDDRAVGELAPGKTLESFQLQRVFGSVPSLGTNFVTIPQNALDAVMSVNTATMNMSCWWEIFFKFRAVMPLADFCIPTLGDIQDTHTIKTTVGGSRL